MCGFDLECADPDSIPITLTFDQFHTWESFHLAYLSRAHMFSGNLKESSFILFVILELLPHGGSLTDTYTGNTDLHLSALRLHYIVVTGNPGRIRIQSTFGGAQSEM